MSIDNGKPCGRGHFDWSVRGRCKTCSNDSLQRARNGRRKLVNDEVKLFIVQNPKNRDVNDIASECMVSLLCVKEAFTELNIPIGQVLVNVQPRECVG